LDKLDLSIHSMLAPAATVTRWPAIEDFDGFCSASLMVDPTAARAVSSVTYDSLGTMEQSADATGSLRTAMLRDPGLEQDDVGEFELALAHLRVAG
jgi:hypothetical protein